jgi:hypothetical protein
MDGIENFCHDRPRIVIRIHWQRTQDEAMVTGEARPRRGRWRRAKARRKLQKAAKVSGQKAVAPDQALHRDQPDRLLLSALKYWEVERDLIEERLAHIRSATAVS